MMRNNLFWATKFKEEFVSQMEIFWDSVEKRILPAFDGIQEEAESLQKETWNSFAVSAGPDSSEEAAANSAFEVGFAHYMNLWNLRQGLLNVLAVFCHHLFEQQLYYFHREELLDKSEENDSSLFKLKEIEKRLAAHMINVKALGAWPKIEELSLVAKVVKHADGWSADELKKRRPEMFTNPELRSNEHLSLLAVSSGPVLQPLFGQDFYVTIDDLKTYVETVINFWGEFADILEKSS
jgi:hypothetical protein